MSISKYLPRLTKYIHTTTNFVQTDCFGSHLCAKWQIVKIILCIPKYSGFAFWLFGEWEIANKSRPTNKIPVLTI